MIAFKNCFVIFYLNLYTYLAIDGVCKKLKLIYNRINIMKMKQKTYRGEV
jgi:hypothetical protein